ncbi:hypothetical protein DFH06DRAFT_1184951 [Mycena polygramma]|nr:hypothetical protein DFH06DRAFT_1215949 [Mycena polygramma]KAJ7666882.1 hypothetical protein DFH06DRAFT_1184951 [Mycena polygramma]
MSTTSTVSSPRAGYVRIKMQLDQSFAFFYMKKEKLLGKAMGMFAKKINHEPAYLRFYFDGNRVKETDTPVSLDMDDQDTENIVDVHLMQLGG